MLNDSIKLALKFTAEYKKCRANCKECTVAEVKKFSDRIKYFRFDAVSGFAQLEDDAPGQKLKEIATDRKVAAVWKNIKWSHDRQLGAWKELEELVKTATKCESCLKELEKDIEKDLKHQPKGTKPNPDIEKLKKQIDSDLKDYKVISEKFKKVAPCDDNLEKEFAKEIKMVADADPTATKFGKMAAKQFEKGVLQRSYDKCKKALKEAGEEAELAVSAAKAGNAKEVAVNLKACTLKFSTVLKYEKIYSKIKTNFKKDIADSDEKKKIEDAIEQFVKFKAEAENLYTDAQADVKKALK